MGVFSSLISSFTGAGAKKAVAQGKAESNAALESGANAARPLFNEAAQGFNGYTQSGEKNQKFYDDLQGLNGPEAQAAAQQVYKNDPYQQDALSQGENAMTRLGNAQSWGAGKFALAGQRVASQNYKDWVATYKGGADAGLNAMTAKAGALTNAGQFEYGYGATKAGNAINSSNAMASANNVFAHNTIGLAGAAAKAYAASDIRLKRDIHLIGSTPAGLPLYRFKYLTGDEEHVGVMAHEAREVFPEAVIERPDGFLMVDYARIG